MRLLFLLCIFTFVFSFTSFSDEGMWMPYLLKPSTYQDMQSKGLSLSLSDIYSETSSSLKDAVVIFGGGCTGAMISNDGLLITNHHCGYGTIQRHSTLEHDYLSDGFWAQSRAEELACPGLKITFLIRSEDVTEKVLQGVKESMSYLQRKELIDKNIEKIEKESVNNTHYEARIESFFSDNQYILFINEIFTDVRLVGAPPSSIGKFGGDTDNWMWPRHTGDFALFRVYTAKDGKPATYSKDNIPLKPRKIFTISIKGIEKNDFTMVFGYPGSTEQYIPSYAVNLVQNETDPTRVQIRTKKLEIINKAMNQDPLVRIQYSAKSASISNGWKKWIGEIKGLKRLNAIIKKQNFEKNITEWINANAERKNAYGSLLSSYKNIYDKLSKFNFAMIYINEAGLGCDAISLALKLRTLEQISTAKDSTTINAIIKDAKNKSKAHFKDYNKEVDKQLLTSMLQIYFENIDKEFMPSFANHVNKNKGNNKYEKYADYCFNKSILVDETKCNNFISSLTPKSYKQLLKDPIYMMMKDYVYVYQNLASPNFKKLQNEIDSLNRIYMKAQMDFYEGKTLYPDANFTLRLTYGQVNDYYPMDGVKYNYFTTLEGIIQKDNPNIYDYAVPQKLKELYMQKEYSRYANKDGKMSVAFTATNHTTGGNSGSPVLNSKGELIGINFDRNWEGTMSDIMYDPAMCRNITLDIRYALFIIDKYANAKHLINEMNIVQ